MQGGLDSWKPPPAPSPDAVSAICADHNLMMIGRASGIMQRYTLPSLQAAGERGASKAGCC